MNSGDVDYIFKVLIIGNSAVGKSNILLRFSDNIFHETFLPTIGVDFKIRNLSIANKSMKLNIWDTAGQERFKTITSAYYKGAQGIILVYDITDPDSFHNIPNWINEVRKHAGPNVVRLLVGNKCDLEADRKVSAKEGKELADSLGIEFMEVSAKARINVDECFTLLSKQMYEQLPEADKKSENGGQSIRKPAPVKNESCCS